jgi:hypothetical protein
MVPCKDQQTSTCSQLLNKEVIHLWSQGTLLVPLSALPDNVALLTLPTSCTAHLQARRHLLKEGGSKGNDEPKTFPGETMLPEFPRQHIAAAPSIHLIPLVHETRQLKQAMLHLALQHHEGLPSVTTYAPLRWSVHCGYCVVTSVTSLRQESLSTTACFKS